MPNYNNSGNVTNWSSGYVYNTADLAEMRVGAEASPLEAYVTTDATPDHQHIYYAFDEDNGLTIIEDDFEPEPTLKELVRDADWTI